MTNARYDEHRGCYFLSDLHLFSKRSRADVYAEVIHATARQAHTIVLGGDIFDFKWSTLPSLEASIAKSIQWLTDLIEPHSECEFHYLLGNHDCHPRFVSELDHLSFAQSQLSWHRHLLRLGDCMFLHGDIADGDLDHHELDCRRARCDDIPPPGRMSHVLYDVVIKSRLHRVAVHMIKRRKTILRRLSRYLKQIGHGPDTGVRHVYFGHIHRNVDGVEYDGMRFHNGGASIRGLPFRIIRAEFNNHGPRYP
jgi:UDP-2,3-diacylglucosamine hydrolase